MTRIASLANVTKDIVLLFTLHLNLPFVLNLTLLGKSLGHLGVIGHLASKVLTVLLEVVLKISTALTHANWIVTVKRVGVKEFQVLEHVRKSCNMVNGVMKMMIVPVADAICGSGVVGSLVDGCAITNCVHLGNNI